MRRRTGKGRVYGDAGSSRTSSRGPGVARCGAWGLSRLEHPLAAAVWQEVPAPPVVAAPGWFVPMKSAQRGPLDYRGVLPVCLRRGHGDGPELTPDGLADLFPVLNAPLVGDRVHNDHAPTTGSELVPSLLPWQVVRAVTHPQ